MFFHDGMYTWAGGGQHSHFHSGSEAAHTSTTTKSSTKKYSQAYVFVNIIQRNTM